jgi:hypothetical protein
LAAAKSRTLLAIYQNGSIHRKLRGPTSEREDTLSNPRGARDAWRKFTEIYGIPRGGAAREPCIDFAAAKNTVADFLNPYQPNTYMYFSMTMHAAPRRRDAVAVRLAYERNLYQVGPNCKTWPNTLTENPY